MASRGLITRADGSTVDLNKQEAEQADLTAKAKKALLVSADGTAISNANKLPVEAEISVGDIEIGAVEIKNATDDTRATVMSDGSQNALAVLDNVSNSLVPQTYDYITLNQTSTEDIWTFKRGGSGGTTVSTITITYTSEAKTVISSVAKA